MTQMNIGENIIMDHKYFRKMIREIWNSSNDEVQLRREELEQLMQRLAAHHVAEETVLFPAMEELPRERRFALELIEEHRSMEILYTDLRNTKYDLEIWVPRLKPILEIHETHMAREESTLIPNLHEMFDQETIDKMSEDYARILDEENASRGMRVKNAQTV